MIPILFDPEDAEMAYNGLGFLSDIINARVLEKLNGIYELEFTYPNQGIHAEEITDRCQVLVKPNPSSAYDCFRIYRINPVSKGTMKVYARHISYDLMGIPVVPFSAYSAADAMNAIHLNAVVDCPFSFQTDKSTAATMTVATPKSIWKLLGGSKGSILDTYGGEYQFYRKTVKLLSHRGQNRGVSIRYGKNLSTLEQDRNCANVYTGVYPYWASQDGTLIQLPEKVIYADGDYPFTHIQELDLSTEFENVPTAEQLRARAIRYMSDNSIGVPVVSWKISFVQLEQTEEYRGTEILEEVLMGDSVSVIFPAMNVNAKARVVETDFDPILERYNSVTLGRVQANLADTILKQQEELQQKPGRVELSGIISDKLGAIFGTRGGAVRFLDTDGDGQFDELYIADNADPDQAEKVWRFNYEGWAASKNGYNGPFTMGATLEDGLLAEFVTAAHLTAGTIQSQDGKSFFLDLDNGILRINSSQTTVDGEPMVTPGDLGDLKERIDNSVTLTATSQVFTKAAGAMDYTPAQIVITAQTNGNIQSYRWYRNETLIQGAISNTFTVTAADIPDKSAVYKVIASDSGGNEYTDIISITKLADGKGIESVTNYYLASTASTGVTVSAAGWTDTVQSVTSSKRYLWNYETIAYTDGTTESTVPCVIGAWGNTGSTGTNGKDGVGISEIKEHYAVSASNITAPTTWYDTPQTMTATNRYLWNYETITYTNGTTADTQKRVIGTYGRDGQDGADGKGISSIVNYYLASTASGGVTISTSGWTTTVQSVTSSKRYLWNYEVVTYTDGTEERTDPCVIGTWGRDGSNGVGISQIAEHYAVSASNTTPPTTWYNTPQTMTQTNRYLWNYETITYTNNTTEDTQKRVIGAYGKDGEDGQNGIDGYTVLLSEEYIEIPVGIDRKPENDGTYTCKVTVYKGAAALTATTGTPGSSQFKVTVKSTPAGVTVSQSPAGTLKISVKTSAAISDYGQVSLTIAVGTMTLNAAVVILANLNAVVVEHESAIENLSDQISLRVSQTTYHTQVPQYLASDPSAGWTAAEKTANAGFLWFDTGNATLKKWTGSTWTTTSEYESWAEYAGSEIKLNKDEIDLKVSKGDVSSQISVESGGVDISGNRMTINSNNFKLDGTGEVVAQGSITATSGTQETNVQGGAVYFKRDSQEIAHLKAGTYLDLPVLLMAMTLNGMVFGIGDTPKMIVNNGLNPDEQAEDVILHNILAKDHLYSTGQIIFRNAGTYENVVSLVGEGTGYEDGSLDVYNCLYVNDWFYVAGDFAAGGTKERRVKTRNYDSVSLYCVESASPYFNDMGSAVLDENGYAEVWIDPVFAETVDQNHSYLVFLSEGHARKYGDYFAIHGTAGATVDWIIYYRQRDYTLSRLDINPTVEPKISPFETEINSLAFAAENETTAIAEALMAEYPDTIEQEAEAYLKNYEQEIYGYDY